MALSATQRDFVASAYAAARAAGLSGVQADLAVSQAIHESAWGTRPSGTNNVHGIKGKGTSVQTHEIEGGKRVNQRASFRNFGSMTESFRAWKGLMERKFSAVMNADTLPEAVKALKAGKQGGYATDPKYDNKVKAIANTVTRAPLAPLSLMAGLNDAPIPPPRFDRPSRPITPTPAPTAMASAPIPERFGPSAAPARGSGTSAPVMAGFTPDPSRFGRVPMAPPAAARGDRVGSGSFSAPPDPARFAPTPSVPSPAPRMAPGPIDPARFGQVPIAHIAPTPAPQMRSPRSMEGPGGIRLDMVPDELRPVPMAPVQPPAAPLPAPVTVQNMPVHSVEAGAPPMVPQAPRPPASGNTVETDAFGNRSVTNKFGATTITGPGGNQSFGSLNPGQASAPSIPSIPGPLGNPFAGMLGEGQPQGFGKTLGGGLMGARMGMVGGLPGMAIGGLLGGLLGRELSKPGGGRLGNLAGSLGIGQQSNLPEFVPNPQSFPAVPGGGYRGPATFSNRSGNDMRSISPAAADAISRGLGGLY
jgi:hypothetical protein